MIWLAFASALTVQATYGPLDATPETYQPPIIRPFEPPSDFGRTPAQGDGETIRHRAPLTRPVTVDAYAASYEVSPSDMEIAYDQGVAQAELDTDRRMGPLDGRWRVTGGDGKPFLSLALTDRGGGRMIEGAWTRLDDRPGVEHSGPAGPATTDGQTIIVPITGGELHLQQAGAGWTGALIQNGRRHPVTVTRPG
ncbi:hypothetical protein [Brevundimonas nasdae]|uniref:hypothetical protein n=1 Tax=Brevundimonas nasdae TaxID=172043 RepID=UPI003F69230F